MIGTLGFVSHELSFVWYGQTPLGCVEVTKATRECVPVEPICVHFRASLKKWVRHKSKDHQRSSETTRNCHSRYLKPWSYGASEGLASSHSWAHPDCQLERFWLEAYRVFFTGSTIKVKKTSLLNPHHPDIIKSYDDHHTPLILIASCFDRANANQMISTS